MIRFRKLHMAYMTITGLLAGLLLSSPSLPLHASRQVQYVDPGQYLYLDNKSDTDHLFSISEAPYIAYVHKGYVEGVYPGLTAVSYGKTGQIERKYVGVKGLLPSKPYLRVGQKQAMHLFGVPKTAISRWTSSNPSVASINREGVLLGKSAGTARISCHLKNGDHFHTIVDVLSGHSASDKDKEEKVTKDNQEKEYGNILLSCEETTFLMKRKDSYKPKVTVRKLKGRRTMPELTWSSSDSSVAKVSALGKIQAVGGGVATITCQADDQSLEFSVNVVTGGESGGSCKLTLLAGRPSKKRNYTLYKQNAHNYSSYDNYLAWHGCAHCSLATVLGAYNEDYEGIKPNEIITGIEKKYADPKAWSREHEKHSLRYQMPLSLHGISSLLTKGKVSNEYVPFFSYDEARADIIEHLKTGNPVIVEVRQKSSKTGKFSKRWTNSYHTMIFLGIFTDGKILLCDSVNRSWYDGGQRYKTVTIDDVMEYMFTSKRTTTSYYYDGAASDGGYIKIFDE